MTHAMSLEALESRKLLSASTSPAGKTVTTIGATSGATAASAVPMFTGIHGTRHLSDGTVDSTGSTDLDRDTSISVTFDAMGTGTLDGTHLGRPSILITDTSTNTVINDPTDVADGLVSKVITSGGGDTIDITFKSSLAEGDHYSIELNSANTQAHEPAYVIRTTNTSGSTNFGDQAFTFTVGSYISAPTQGFTSAFEAAVQQTAAGNHSFTAVAWGPDQRLYAADTQGNIYAYTVGSDGTLTLANTIHTIQTHFGGDNRLITGIVFKKSSTKTNMEMWVSDSEYAFGNEPGGSDPVEKSADNFTGEIDALSGTNFTTIEPLVVNIPRSVKDHTNNQIVFAPDGRTAYFGIAAMNAMGKADSVWGGRPENIYSATIMQLRASGASSIYNFIRTSGGPVNLLLTNTVNPGDPNDATGIDTGGNTVGTHYNIFKGSNPLRIYADGIRNDFDMVFASNGHLYAGINGSSSGGNTPATPSTTSIPEQNRPDKDLHPGNYTGPTSPGLTNVTTVEEDTLLDVKNGAYYGHPDPARGEYILDGGNPTAGKDPYEFAGNGTSGSPGYAVGQEPDRNYTLPIYDFGQDYSPDGMIQYQSVNGKDPDLNGYLLVDRYSSGGDILALQPTADGAIGKVQTNIPGLTGLGTPLDMIEDPNTGNIYVAVLNDETGAAPNGGVNGSIQLLKPTTTNATGTPAANLSSTLLKTHPVPGDKTGDTIAVTLQNTGEGNLIVDHAATRLAGSGKKNFVVSNLPKDDITIAPGDTFTFDVKGVLGAGKTATAIANLQIKTNDPNVTSGYVTVGLRAINTTASLVSAGTVMSTLKAASVFSQGSVIASTKLTTSNVVSQLDGKDVSALA